MMLYDAKFIIDNFEKIMELDEKGKNKEILDFVYPNGIDLKQHQNDLDDSIHILLADDFIMKCHQIKSMFKITGNYVNLHETMYIKCQKCGKTLWLYSDMSGKCSLYETDKLPDFIRQNVESKGYDMQECFDVSKPIEYRFTTKSEKFVIANDFRELLDDDIMDKHSISNNAGIHEMTKEFAKNNMFIGYVGNTTCDVGITDDNKIIIVNTCLDEYFYDSNNKEDEKEFFEWLQEYNDIDYYNKYIKPVIELNYHDTEHISCSLWWVMGIDASLINVDKIKTDYVILDVEPNTEYKFTVDYTIAGEGNCYHYQIEKV